MRTSRRPRHTFARLSGVLALSAVLATGSLAAAGAQENDSNDTGDDDVDGDSVDALQDGAYEPCSAYFGFGKDNGAQDLVHFDVAVEGDHEGPTPSVGDGIEVVFEVTYEDGTVIECTPVEVSQDEWNLELSVVETNLPQWPGPGHYPYPSVLAFDSLDGWPVTGVAYRVVEIPDGLTLVAPGVAPAAAVNSELVPLRSIFPGPEQLYGWANPWVMQLITDVLGPDVAAQWDEDGDDCVEDPGPDTLAAFELLYDTAGITAPLPPELDCGTYDEAGYWAAWTLNANEIVANTEPIVLDAGTTPPDSGQAPAAAAVETAPRFTG